MNLAWLILFPFHNRRCVRPCYHRTLDKEESIPRGGEKLQSDTKCFPGNDELVSWIYNRKMFRFQVRLITESLESGTTKRMALLIHVHTDFST